MRNNPPIQFATALSAFSAPPLVATPTHPACEICVIVPVRNEAAILEACLSALADQIELDGRPFAPDRYEIIVLANNCSDDSAAIARRFAFQHPHLALHVVERALPPAEAYIGRVRQLLMDEAYRRLSQGWRRGVIASTDGDSQVSPTWLAATLEELALGADAVGGRVLLDRASRAALDPHARAYHLREVGYRSLIAELEDYLDPIACDRWPRHYQHYGASLTVTAEMYVRSGGLPPVRTPEDVAFYQAMLRSNVRFRHSPLVRVFTSGRQAGRAPQGLANQLSEWSKMGQQRQPFLVESAETIATRLRAKRQLRGLWEHTQWGDSPTAHDLRPLAQKLAIPADWLGWQLRHADSFASLFEQVELEDKLSQAPMLVDIDRAIHGLRLHLSALRGRRPPRSTPVNPNLIATGGVEESKTQGPKELASDLLSS